MTDIDFTEIEAVLKAGIDDIYRFGLGEAIRILEVYRNNSTDPDSFNHAIQHLRETSAGINLAADK